MFIVSDLWSSSRFRLPLTPEQLPAVQMSWGLTVKFRKPPRMKIPQLLWAGSFSAVSALQGPTSISQSAVCDSSSLFCHLALPKRLSSSYL